VLIKKSQLLMGLALAASLGGLVVASSPAQAAIPSSVRALYGHKFLKAIKKDTPDIVAVARVVGKAGSIVSLRFIDPTAVTVNGQNISTATLDAFNWNTQLGDDVFLAYRNGSWEYLEDNTSNEISWISRLKLKAVSDVKVSKIDWSQSAPVSLPPAQTRPVAPAPAPAPVRGLW